MTGLLPSFLAIDSSQSRLGSIERHSARLGRTPAFCASGLNLQISWSETKLIWFLYGSWMPLAKFHQVLDLQLFIYIPSFSGKTQKPVRHDPLPSTKIPLDTHSLRFWSTVFVIHFTCIIITSHNWHFLKFYEID